MAKKAPGSIDIGSAGLGTVTHLAIGLFEGRAGVKLTHVPYRGGAPMLQDLLAGQIGAAFVLVSAVASYVRSGKLRALAVVNRRRDALLPNVPTAHEAGLADFRITTWFGSVRAGPYARYRPRSHSCRRAAGAGIGRGEALLGRAGRSRRTRKPRRLRELHRP